MRYRKKAREEAILILYRWDVGGGNLLSVAEEHIKEREIGGNVEEYLRKLINTINENILKIDSIIEEHLENWEFDRLGYIEKSILRLGTAELLYIGVPDVGRAFNDYIDFAKKYADEKAGKFIHGVLGRIYKTKLSSEEKVNN